MLSQKHRRRNAGVAVVEGLDSRRLLSGSAANPLWTNVYASADYSVGPGPIAFYANHQNNPSLATATVRFILSEDTVVGNADDIVLASSPYATSAGPVVATLPDLAAGTYHFFATCNNANAVSAGDLTVGTHTEDGPDLTPAPENPLFGLPDSFPMGEYHGLSFDIINRGTTTAAPVNAALYLSPTPGLSSGAYLVKKSGVMGPTGEIAPRSQGDIIFTANFPSPMPPGVYYPVIVIDPDNTIAEADETNNVFVGKPVTITAPTVDISLVSISTESTATINPYYWTDPIPMDVTFRSTGTGANLRLFLSLSLDDVAGNADDIPVGYSGYFDAPAGSSDLITVHTTASYSFYGQATPIVAGTYHLVASTDAPPDVTPADNTILGPTITLEEPSGTQTPPVWTSSEQPVTIPVEVEPIGDDGLYTLTNWTSAAATTVLKSDLSGTLSAGRSTVVPGKAGQASLVLKNAGGTAVARKYGVTLYLSDDATLSDDDVAFSTRSITANIAAHRAATLKLRYALPKGTALGTKYLIAVADVAEDTAKALVEQSSGQATSARVMAATKVKVTGPHLTAAVQSIKAGPREGTSMVKVRVANDGTALFAAAANFELLTDATDPVSLLKVKKVLSLKAGRHVDLTFVIDRPSTTALSVTVS